MGAKLLETDTKFRTDIRSMDELLQNTKVPPKWTLEGDVMECRRIKHTLTPDQVN